MGPSGPPERSAQGQGRLRIASLRLRCTEASGDRARLRLTATLDAAEPGDVELRTTVSVRTGIDHVHRARVGSVAHEVSWVVDVTDPPLWWPRALAPDGERPVLVDVEVQAVVVGASAGAGGQSDSARRRTGFRQVRMRRFVLEVNGERLFLKGASLGPTRMPPGDDSVARSEGDVALAQEAGLDLVRVNAHSGRPQLYDAADRAGLLLWQDVPCRPGSAGDVRRQARAAVDLLAHHPSIAVWCAHTEPPALDPRPPSEVVRRSARPSVPANVTRAILDCSRARVLDQADGSRPVVPSPGRLVPGASGVTFPAWFGWEGGDERDLPRWLRRLPVLARFVGGFGAQAVPTTAAWMEPERWPDLDWDRLDRTHGVHEHLFDRRFPPAAFPTFSAWQAATQDHQATVLRHHVEELRRLKYRPAGGFCASMLADAHPAVSWSVLDHDRVPKAGFAALRAACAPVIVVADRLAATYRPGAAVALDLHVVSDLRHPLDRCVVRADLAWPGGSHRWGFTGSVPPDDVVRVGTLSIVVPDAPGPLTLDLRLEGPAAAAATYRSQIVPA